MKAWASLHCLLIVVLLTIATTATVLPRIVLAEEPPPLSITLEEYSYPYPVSYLPLVIEGQDLKMAYMDVLPSGGGNGKSVLLLHGKNFSGAYWKDTITFLTDNGYLVVFAGWDREELVVVFEQYNTFFGYASGCI